MFGRHHLSWFWAKLGCDTWPDRYHPVICHLIDVGQVAHALWQSALRDRVRRWVTGRLGLESEDAAGRWIAFWVGAHDIGKLTPCFQYRQNHQTEPIKCRLEASGFQFGTGSTHHSKTGTKALSDALVSGGDGQWPQLDRQVANKVAVAVGGHHGTFPLSWNDIGGDLGGEAWAGARRELLGELARLFEIVDLQPPPPPVADDQSVWMFLAGLTAVADWIGSNVGYFPSFGNPGQVDQPFDVDSYSQNARQKATDALQKLGWLGRPLPTNTPVSFAEATGLKGKPRELQEHIVALASQMTTPRLVIVEAPMGEGKTEAAWYVADWWDRHGGAGTYVALPTMATSNQMFTRVERFLASRLGKHNLQLLHGKAALNPDFEQLKNFAEQYDTERPSAVVAEEWFAKDKKQALLAPYGVGTIDQALLAVLQTKHVFVRLFGLAGKCVILDEVHAYDAYMTTLMVRLLRWLAVLGCPVVLLSATLPAAKRRELLKAYTGVEPESMEEKPYPRVTTAAVGDKVTSVVHVSPDETRRKEIHLDWVDDDGGLVGKLKETLADGGCAAVIRNTVGLAQQTYLLLRDGLKDAGIRVELFHARFPFGQRSRIERRVLRRYGTKGEQFRRRRQKVVLVATQVIEQSLDLDFDVMVSDVAPVDLVLQRAGRLHRHGGRVRPAGVAKPHLWLINPGEKDGRPDFGKSEYVYSPHVLFGSLLVLQAHRQPAQTLELPGDIDALVQAVYSATEPPLNLDDSGFQYWSVTKEEYETIVRSEEDEADLRQIRKPSFSGVLARVVSEPRDEDNPDLHPTHQALTRLARPTAQLVCLIVGSDTTLRMPHDNSLVPTLTVRRMSDGGTEDVGRLMSAELTVADFRVLRELWTTPRRPVEWQDVGMLQRHHLVTFTNGAATIGDMELQLDHDLGLMVVRGSSEGDE
jgi:CRISPR-associated endonuclease/helicase Cas3